MKNDNLDPLPVDLNGPDVIGVIILMSFYALVWPLPVDLNGPDVIDVIILMSFYALVWFFIGVVIGWSLWA